LENQTVYKIPPFLGLHLVAEVAVVLVTVVVLPPLAPLMPLLGVLVLVEGLVVLLEVQHCRPSSNRRRCTRILPLLGPS